MKISYELKKACVEARGTKTIKEIYNELFLPQHKGMSYETFRHKLRDWSKKQMADNDTLALGTYEGFTPHRATVQVDGNGNIRQAWIKQEINDNVYDDILEAIKSNIKPIKIPSPIVADKCMLEIPLFDMHFGIATIDHYTPLLTEILYLISTKQRECINILIGQDLLHTNDFRGHTAKGTDIGKIDFKRAWQDAWLFWTSVIEKCLANSQEVHLRYSKGNHDECTSWCFLKALQAKYPQCKVDDSLKSRKCICWNGVFIGYGHIDYTNNTNKIFQNFVLDFPKEFADAKVREIHTGHTHTESKDNGLMVRRLGTGNITDDWSDDNGYVGSHKRFEIFEWCAERLKAIYYI